MNVTALRILIWISGNTRKDSPRKENVHLKKRMVHIDEKMKESLKMVFSSAKCR